MIIDIVKVFLPAILTFLFGLLFTPFLTDFLYKNKMWKHKGGKTSLDGSEATLFNSLHKEKGVNTPRMGGIIIWFSTGFTMFLIWTIAIFFPNETTTKLDIISRNQTWLPLATLIFGALIGLIDDYLEIIRSKKETGKGGLSLKNRLLVVSTICLACAFWFYYKLDINSIGIPFENIFGTNQLILGPIFIVVFLLVSLFIYSGGVIDGIDGLAGGVFATMFASYAGIAFYQQQIDLAGFCIAIVGGILVFLWFNIPPARFYMSETGTMGLTITLTVVAFMTDRLGGGYGLLVLPIVAMPLVATSLSDIIQVLSKKIRGKKVFLIAPIHHHFEAIGWPSYKVTMRYWIFSTVCAILGIILAIVG